MTKRKRKPKLIPATSNPEQQKPENDLSGVLRTIRKRKPNGGQVALQAYAYRSIAA